MHAPGADSPMGWVGSCSEDHYCKPRFPFEYPAAGSQILYMCIIAKALVDSGEEPLLSFGGAAGVGEAFAEGVHDVDDFCAWLFWLGFGERLAFSLCVDELLRTAAS
jgi:hypothetical protein